MKGRLRVLNDSRYPDDEVKRLVRFGMDEIEVPRVGVLAIVKNTSRDYSGTAYDYLNSGIPLWAYKRMTRNERFLIVLRVGPPERFPIKPWRRNGVVHDTRSWQEALVGITAHEGLHVQHSYDHAYRGKTTVRRKVRAEWEQTITQRRRLGDQRIEPRCEAFEAYMTRRYREEVTNDGNIVV